MLMKGDLNSERLARWFRTCVKPFVGSGNWDFGSETETTVRHPPSPSLGDYHNPKAIYQQLVDCSSYNVQ